MTNNNNQISVTYSDAELRNLVEEYITQQKSEFTLKGACSFILYWAVEDSKIADAKIPIESNEINSIDQDRLQRILEAVKADGRIVAINSGAYRKF